MSTCVTSCVTSSNPALKENPQEEYRGCLVVQGNARVELQMQGGTYPLESIS